MVDWFTKSERPCRLSRCHLVIGKQGRFHNLWCHIYNLCYHFNLWTNVRFVNTHIQVMFACVLFIATCCFRSFVPTLLILSTLLVDPRQLWLYSNHLYLDTLTSISLQLCMAGEVISSKILAGYWVGEL